MLVASEWSEADPSPASQAGLRSILTLDSELRLTDRKPRRPRDCGSEYRANRFRTSDDAVSSGSRRVYDATKFFLHTSTTRALTNTLMQRRSTTAFTGHFVNTSRPHTSTFVES